MARMTQKGIQTLARHNQQVAEDERIDFAAEDAEKKRLMDADADAFMASSSADDEFPVYHRGRRIK